MNGQTVFIPSEDDFGKTISIDKAFYSLAVDEAIKVTISNTVEDVVDLYWIDDDGSY